MAMTVLHRCGTRCPQRHDIDRTSPHCACQAQLGNRRAGQPIAQCPPADFHASEAHERAVGTATCLAELPVFRQRCAPNAASRKTHARQSSSRKYLAPDAPGTARRRTLVVAAAAACERAFYSCRRFGWVRGGIAEPDSSTAMRQRCIALDDSRSKARHVARNNYCRVVDNHHTRVAVVTHKQAQRQRWSAPRRSSSFGMHIIMSTPGTM